MAKTHEVGKHCTTIYQSDGMTCVRYHSTEVVRFNDKHIILDSGGWETATTKLRMNQASQQFGLGFYVYQKKGWWFVVHNFKTMRFEDGMVLTRLEPLS